MAYVVEDCLNPYALVEGGSEGRAQVAAMGGLVLGDHFYELSGDFDVR